MADRVASDHDSVESVRGELVRAGRTDRPRVAIPADAADAFPESEVVRLVLDGTERFTLVAVRMGEDTVERSSTSRRESEAHPSPRSLRSRGPPSQAREDRLELRGAHETPDDAEDPTAGSDGLGDWQDAHGVRFGGAVLVDVVEEGYKYGLRPPGERVFYETGRPDSSLADIARNLDG